MKSTGTDSINDVYNTILSVKCQSFFFDDFMLNMISEEQRDQPVIELQDSDDSLIPIKSVSLEKIILFSFLECFLNVVTGRHSYYLLKFSGKIVLIRKTYSICNFIHSD